MTKPIKLRDVEPKTARGKPLARKRYVCRLSLELASRLEALHEAYPGKMRSELLEDLLRLGLGEVERAWAGAAEAAFQPDTKQPIYLPTGPFAEFHSLVHKHHLALEHELAKDDLQPPHPVDEYVLGPME